MPHSNQYEGQVLTEDTTVSGAECYLVNLVDPAFKIIVQVKYMLKIKKFHRFSDLDFDISHVNMYKVVVTRFSGM